MQLTRVCKQYESSWTESATALVKCHITGCGIDNTVMFLFFFGNSIQYLSPFFPPHFNLCTIVLLFQCIAATYLFLDGGKEACVKLVVDNTINLAHVLFYH